jgi:crotonobetainyl-CoA:carnitine CoA-transferase CaiB-like acyl-CoA transferase
VIKVEPPDGAEERRFGSQQRYGGDTRMSLAYNRGKQSVAIDLRQPPGREILYQLARKADVVVQNFAPAVASKLGIDYDSLRALNPRLIFVSSTAFGDVGPYRKRKGFDIIAHAAAGLMSNYADEDGAPRGPGAIAYVDICTGMFSALGVVAALHQRAQTGEGQKLETSLFSTALALQAQSLLHIERLDQAQHEQEQAVLRTARLDGKTHTEVIDTFAELRLRADLPDTVRPVEVPDCEHRPTDRQTYPYYRVYPTADGYLSVAALNRTLREKLCSALEIADANVAVDFGDSSDTVYHQQKATMHEIEQRLLQNTNEHWVARLEAAGVPCGPVSYRPDLYEDPQVQALEMMWRLDNAQHGSYLAPGHPIRFSKTPVRAGKGSPTLGENTAEVLAEIGYSEAAVSELRVAGIIK